MKLLLFGLILIYTNYLICQESNSKFYKQYKSFKCTKEVSKARAKFCRTESTCKNGDSSIIVKDLKENRIIKEEYFSKNKPIGVWKSFDSKKRNYTLRDFSNIKYFSNISEEEKKAFLNFKNDSTKKIVLANYNRSNEDFNTYLSKRIKYPKEVFKNGIEGKVYISFFIEKNGAIDLQYIIKGANPYLDFEAWKVLKNMPKWNPAIIDDKPVKSLYTLPISFILL